MPRLLGIAILLGAGIATASIATADAPRNQLRALVSMELHNYAPQTDPDNLSQHQLGAIYSIMHSGKSQGDKTSLIRSVIGGRNTLRSLLFGRR